MVPEDALTIPQIAQQLRVHQATVRLWINQGRLKAQRASPKPQARWWVAPEDLQAMLDARHGRGGHATPEFETDYEPGPDEPGLGMLSSIDIGEETEGA
jgi:Helix-turn-helix domain